MTGLTPDGRIGLMTGGLIDPGRGGAATLHPGELGSAPESGDVTHPFSVDRATGAATSSGPVLPTDSIDAVASPSP